MNCSKTSRSAWSQSLKAESSRHPPKHQSSRARRSICCCASRCSPTVKATRSTIKPGDGFLIWGSSVRSKGWRCGFGSRCDGSVYSQQKAWDCPWRRSLFVDARCVSSLHRSVYQGGGSWEMRMNTFGPQMGSNRSNTVVLVPFAKVLVILAKLETSSQVPLRRFELNCGTNA